nr:hypothetical protein WMHIBSEC_WMHIBSEC_CDS_0030 [Caudoviricetes sp.]CAI9751727.1 hypothetical protein AZFZUZMX_AZFZUZMX_CDS_0030 [Caudoviricetes sp.]
MVVREEVAGRLESARTIESLGVNRERCSHCREAIGVRP